MNLELKIGELYGYYDAPHHLFKEESYLIFLLLDYKFDIFQRPTITVLCKGEIINLVFKSWSDACDKLNLVSKNE